MMSRIRTPRKRWQKYSRSNDREPSTSNVSWNMTEQENRKIAEALGKIELTLAQMLDTQREGSKSQNDWFAADIRLREEFIENQRTLIETNRAAQRTSKRNMVMMGMFAGFMLVIGVGLITEPWWLPAVLGSR